MKSRLFSNFDPESEENRALGKHLRVFLGLTDSQRTVCVNALPQVVIAKTRAATRTILDRIERETHCTRVDLTPVLRLLQFFLDRMQKEETRTDTSAQWGDDLVELGVVTPPEAATFITYLERVRHEVFPKVKRLVKQREYAVGVFPSLNEFGVTVEVRGVQDRKYQLGTPIDEYLPRVEDVVGIVSMHIGVDRGEGLCFQVDELELDLLIDGLQAAKADLQALQRALKFTRRQLTDSGNEEDQPTD